MRELHFCCCSKCFEEIAKKSPLAGRLWLDLCAAYTKYRGPFAVKNLPSIGINILERNGYLVTTEDKNYIAIRMNGYNRDEMGNEVYCITRSEHDD